MVGEKEIRKIWVERPDEFMSVEHTSQKRVLHPTLARIINESDCAKLLDYGCGDGRMIKMLRPDIQVDVFDISPGMLELVQENVGDRLTNVFTSARQIPSEGYDIAVLSMVMMCIDNEVEFLRVLSNTCRAIHSDGRVLIAVTHPCFRQHAFSDFRTSYGNGQSFEYHKEGEGFTVYIDDKMPASVVFEDYHWSLSFTINKIIEAGLIVERVIETTDDLSHPEHNPFFSPFLILTCSKHES